MALVEIDENDCWNWHGTCFPGGRPMFYLASRTPVSAQRFAVAVTHKVQPMYVGRMGRTCSNILCVAPKHHKTKILSVPKAMVDRQVFGARVHGSAHYSAKLTRDDVLRILIDAENGVSMYSLARRYHVDFNVIRRILTGKAWVRVVVDLIVEGLASRPLGWKPSMKLLQSYPNAKSLLNASSSSRAKRS